MKIFWRTLRTGLAVGLSLFVTLKARGTLEVSASLQIHSKADFQAPLASKGTWVDVRLYGHCWRPGGVAVDWRPYCDGWWVWTDCGWYWQSDEPWGWACYHYGTWVYDVTWGWIWVPDIEWAPAWVYWRVGGGFVGWAPCAPHGAVAAPSQFAFVEVAHFRDHVRPSSVIVNNPTISSRTRQSGGAKRETRDIGGSRQSVIVNEGPRAETIQKASGNIVSAVPIQEAVRLTPAGNDATHNATQATGRPSPKAAPKHPQQNPRGPSQKPVPPPARNGDNP
ncbi:MAG TPA: DUF6600 domain-containing protein, partial [Candidatus Nitrosotalea sp.]|nr:DUF6600 domain-containing protein [Candidatus Nitrosotalea sp.]